MNANSKGIKSKVKGKIAEVKAKVKGKCKGATSVAVIVALLALCGCATSEPASRVTSATYGDIMVRIENSTNCTVRLTIGDGAMSSSDSQGSTETTTSSPSNTTDIKPDIDTTVGGASGSADPVSAVTSAVKNIANACTDGSCNDGYSSSSAKSCSSCSESGN